MNFDSFAWLVGRGSSGRGEWMSFDSDLVLFLILQEHNGDTNLFSSGLTIESQHNFQLLEIIPGACFYLRCNYQPKAAKVWRLLWVKVIPAVISLWLSVSHSMERDMTLNQLTDSTHTPTLARSPSSNYCQNKIEWPLWTLTTLTEIRRVPLSAELQFSKRFTSNVKKKKKTK